MQADGVAVQALLIPEVVDLPPDQLQAVVENASLLGELGLEIEAFGEGSVLVRGVPALLGTPDPGIPCPRSGRGTFRAWRKPCSRRQDFACAGNGGVPRFRASRTPAQ